MRGDDPPQGGKHGTAQIRYFLFQIGDQFPNALPFEVVLRAAEAAGENREVLQGGEGFAQVPVELEQGLVHGEMAQVDLVLSHPTNFSMAYKENPNPLATIIRPHK